MRLKNARLRMKAAELLKAVQFLLIMLGVEMLVIWAACHYTHREEVRTVLFDQMLRYTFVAGIILIVGLTEAVLPKMKQTIKLIGISVIVYLASLVYFTYMPIGLLKHLDVTLLYSILYALFIIALIYSWRIFEVSKEKKYKACITEFLKISEDGQN